MKTPNTKMHRIRNRRRLESPTNKQRTLNRHTALAAAEMNAIVGVAGVVDAEVVASITNNATLNPVGARDIRAGMQRGVTTVAGVEALGIPIA